MKWRRNKCRSDRYKRRREWTFLKPENGRQQYRTVPDNPCIPYLRTVIETVLQERGILYRDFYPVIFDFDEEALQREKQAETENAIFLYETECEIARLRRQRESILRQLAPGLNRIMVCTKEPAGFTDFCEMVYENEGLVVELSDETEQAFPTGSFIIDLGLWGDFPTGLLRPDIFYLPIYRKMWEITGNIDILAPIGYNTVIVKGAAGAKYLTAEDRFEQEFYRK